jgi:hypothetical protein
MSADCTISINALTLALSIGSMGASYSIRMFALFVQP